MADMKGVGPDSPIQPTGSREKRVPTDPDAFKKKIEKAGETDPEQKKKRRQREEEAEEVVDKMKAARKADKTKETIAPFELGKKLATKPALDTLDKGAPVAASASTPVTPPLSDDLDKESTFWDEEEDFAIQTTAPPPATPTPTLPSSSGARQKPPMQPSKPIKEVDVEVAPLSVGKAKKKHADEEAMQLTAQAPYTGAEPQPILETAPPPPAPPPPLYRLSPTMLALFDRMVGLMTVMNQSGIKETTVKLTADSFKTSRFYGAEITIREYDTAPTQFNVEVKGNAEAVAQFQANIPNIEANFRAGKYNFGIHRLETSLIKIEEEPVSRDKEDEEDKEEQ